MYVESLGQRSTSNGKGPPITTNDTANERAPRGPNGCPERELVRAVSEEWEAAGITCVGKEVVDEIRIRSSNGTLRRIDLQITKADLIGLVEFKHDASDFMSACGQLYGYHDRMRRAVDSDGAHTAYRQAYDRGAAFLLVATSTEPDADDVRAASSMFPPIRAWWPGCPPPV